jgi:16S rRNA (cytosine967-C5)-methyltransferase
VRIRRNQFDALQRAAAAVLPLSIPADRALSQFFRGEPGIGQRDRAWIAEAVFALLRRLRSLTALARGPDPRRLALAALVRTGAAKVGDLAEVCTRPEIGWLEAVAAASEPNDPATRADLPDWLWKRLGEAWGDAGRDALAKSLLAAAPLDVRVNPLEATRDEARAALAESGIDSAPTLLSPYGLRLVGKPALQSHPLLREGAIEVQDEGSQLVCLLVAPKRHDMVVDFCAGAGGKTLLLGALMRSQGRLYALDVVDTRLARLRPRVARAGLSNVQPVLIRDERDERVKRLAGKIDRVLVDAPCTGTGTLRRNPDLKWRQTEDAVAELAAKQRRILDAASRLLKPGGRLVYATCSLLPDENDAVVDGFLADHPEFDEGDAGAELARQGVTVAPGRRLRLAPHVDGCDGFFAAVLERRREGAPAGASATGQRGAGR